MKDPSDVGSLSRPVMFQPVSAPLQRGVRFFRHPKPARRSTHLATRPSHDAPAPRETYGVSTFRSWSMCEVRYLLSTDEFAIHEAVSFRPLSDPRCLLAWASFPEGQPLWLIRHNDLYHRFTYVYRTHCL